MPNKVILISGGSSGLGKAIAEKLAPNNHVIILSHNLEKLRQVSREINCDFIEAELTDYESLKTAVNKIIEKHHALDVLVNSVGIWIEGELEENETRKIKELIDINTTGTIFLTRAVLPGMRFRKAGQIINIISQAGLSANKGSSIYHASQWALTGFTKCLQEDLSEESIRVTGVYPGLTKPSVPEQEEVASLVEYVINLNPGTHIPEVGIINKTTKSQYMDDTNTPTIDLNIDPNMIAAQDTSPQATPITSPVSNPGVIDITPGSNLVDPVPLSEPKTVDITPPIEPTPESIQITPSPMAPVVPPSVPVVPNTIPDGNISQIPAPMDITKLQTAPMVQSSPLAEDPDLVKLIK